MRYIWPLIIVLLAPGCTTATGAGTEPVTPDALGGQGGESSIGSGGAETTPGAGGSAAQGGAGGSNSTPTSLRLCSWNIKKLGHGTTKDYEAVRQVLEDNCDASVIIEVMQKGGTSPGYSDLMAALGESWTGVVTDEPRPNTTSGNSEFYAVVWRADVLSHCAGWEGLRYVEDNDGSDIDTGDDNYSREPAYGCFVMSGSAGSFDFLMAAYHAVWGDGTLGTIQGEVQFIDAAVAEMKLARPGENDVLVLGDFNLNSRHLDPLTSLTLWSEDSGSTLNSSGDLTANQYDYVLVDDLTLTPELGAEAEVLDVRGVVADDATFYSTVSDHLPIRTTLTLVGEDDD